MSFIPLPAATAEKYDQYGICARYLRLGGQEALLNILPVDDAPYGLEVVRAHVLVVQVVSSRRKYTHKTRTHRCGVRQYHGPSALSNMMKFNRRQSLLCNSRGRSTRETIRTHAPTRQCRGAARGPSSPRAGLGSRSSRSPTSRQPCRIQATAA